MKRIKPQNKSTEKLVIYVSPNLKHAYEALQEATGATITASARIALGDYIMKHIEKGTIGGNDPLVASLRRLSKKEAA